MDGEKGTPDEKICKPVTLGKAKDHDPSSPHHDVLVTTPITEKQPTPKIYRFIVNKESGDYESCPFELKADGTDYQKLGERKVQGLIQQDSESGIAFATLPVKDEPASSAGSCYLINRQLLNYTTVWTRAPWNDHPDDFDPLPRYVTGQVREDPPNPTPRFLLALNTGEVLDVQVSKNLDGGRAIQASPLDLRANPDVWRLLRNGCVAGVAVHADGVKLPVFSLASVHVTPPRRRGRSTEITGTLDFKWRRGSTIKVQFTNYDPEADYGVGLDPFIDEIERLAKGWVEEVDLDIAFDRTPLDRVHDDYDVLVSLEPLGPARDVKRGVEPDEPEQQVVFPSSQLGSYAEREERNVPTMFLGCPDGLKDAQGPIALAEYFGSSTFRSIVLHEFGHALGLAHLHQHPGLSLNPFAGPPGRRAGIRQTIEKGLGIEVDETFVREQLQGRWPGAAYSEWPAIRPGEDDDAAIERWLKTSVMIGLPAREVLLAGRKLLPARDELGETDREWIQLLYP